MRLSDREISDLGKRFFAEVRAEFPDEPGYRPFRGRWLTWALHKVVIFFTIGAFAYVTAIALMDRAAMTQDGFVSTLERINEVIGQ